MTALEVACPNCQAAKLEQCTVPTSTGRRIVTWYHLARQHAALEWNTTSKGDRS